MLTLEPQIQYRNTLVTQRFELPKEFKDAFRQQPVEFGFGAFSEAVFFRTYSRVMEDGKQERWPDTVLRVVEGLLSVRKDWYYKIGVRWNELYWTLVGKEMAEAIFDMRMLPPGRGLWAMGTDHVYRYSSMALNNCGLAHVIDNLARPATWTFDALMLGTGVGFTTNAARIKRFPGPGEGESIYQVPDTREGWVRSLELLISSYEQGGPTWRFDYSLVRPAGSPIRGFGGIASGPDPLRKLHERVRLCLEAYRRGEISQTRLIADVINAVGVAVVSGNVRRSAELCSGSIYDDEFLNLKNYQRYPERQDIGWMANNSVVLTTAEEFELLPSLAERIRDNGEPGIINLINFQKYARYGKKKIDLAVGTNPCSEIGLEPFELCCLAEVFPTRCASLKEFWRALELATLYASTVSLLPSHDPDTNAVISRNRRIGVSVSGIADWIDGTNWSYVTMALRRGYEEHVEPVNRVLAAEAGIPVSVRLTTCKPSGTISTLAGVSPGVHWPVFQHGIRRMRISVNSPVVEPLVMAGVPHELDAYSDNTLVFEFPLASGFGKTRPLSEVSIWEQASLVAMVQREFADNAVSNTLTFSPSKESKQIERVLAAFAPLVKSMSMLPSQDEQKSYAQPPYESTTKGEYDRRMSEIKEIDWAGFVGSDGINSKYCDTGACELDAVSGT